MSSALDAVVFDLDATLTDFDAVEAEVWSRTFAHLRAALPAIEEAPVRQRHLTLRERFYDEMLAGRTDMAGYRRAHLRAVIEPWGELDPVVLDACIAERDAHRDEARLAEGAADAVADLRALGLRVGVLTNGPGTMQRRKLEVIGLHDALDAICASGELGVAKPDPRAFALAAAALDSAPERTAMIGDNVTADIVGALGAGYALAVHVGSERPEALPPGAEHVTRLADAVALLRP
ncbi:MAG TPA: HAD family hydrolase [Solirubrobacteraceae bacterium]|nr:HAD family hydrolase [Solirubrobacteraceae bacterium]